MEKAIEIQGLTKYYGKNKGVEGLNLTVEAGEFFGFIGPNGAGKSTTIRCILGLLRMDAGDIRVFGTSVRTHRDKILREISYMPSESVFYSGMRVKELLRLSAKLYGERVGERTQELCERLKLDTEKRVEELSLGNRKKVGIVCALQHPARLYLLDEPTSGLDPLMQKEFFSLLKEKNEEGATIFLSSHVLGEVQRYCHRAAIIRDGGLAAMEEVSALNQKSAKKVTLYGVRKAPELSGVTKAEQGEDGVTFLYHGKIPELLEALDGLPIQDMTMNDLDLEDIFFHFYEGGTKR